MKTKDRIFVCESERDRERKTERESERGFVSCVSAQRNVHGTLDPNFGKNINNFCLPTLMDANWMTTGERKGYHILEKKFISCICFKNQQHTHKDGGKGSGIEVENDDTHTKNFLERFVLEKSNKNILQQDSITLVICSSGRLM